MQPSVVRTEPRGAVRAGELSEVDRVPVEEPVGEELVEHLIRRGRDVPDESGERVRGDRTVEDDCHDVSVLSGVGRGEVDEGQRRRATSTERTGTGGEGELVGSDEPGSDARGADLGGARRDTNGRVQKTG